MKKIIAYKTVLAYRIEDIDALKGFDSQANALFADGFVPLGEMKISYTPTYVFPGSATTLGGNPTYYQQFVKYAE